MKPEGYCIRQFCATWSLLIGQELSMVLQLTEQQTAGPFDMVVGWHFVYF